LKEKWWIVSNYILFIGFAAIVVAFQKSAWFQILGSLPLPQLWVPVLVFWCLYREPHESVIMTYLLTAIISTQTSLPFSTFLTINVVIFAGIWIIKRRLYWSSSGFYTVVCGGATLSVFLIDTVLSLFFEDNSIRTPEWFSWLLSPLLTMLFSLIFYQIFTFFDSLTKKEIPREASHGGPI